MLSQLGQLDLKEKGLEMPLEDIYSPDRPCIANAILQIGGGSGSFVSSRGLVLTNHHVAYTALQRNSTVASDILTDGFLAREMSSEIPAPGYQARLMVSMKDVTDEVMTSYREITDPVEQENEIKTTIKKIIDSLDLKDDDMLAEVARMHNGKQFILYVYRIFKDIRLVYSPPLSVGNYGGEIDNWVWPRHTGDFSFMRVYVSPDGRGSGYSSENVPYNPSVWLKVSEGDLDEDDFCFIIGYPGFTTRYRSSNSVSWNLNYNYPFTADNFREIIKLAEELTLNDPEGRIKVAGFTKGLANTMKNYQGKIEGMKKTNFLQEKIDFEQEFIQWLSTKPDLKAKYGSILSDEKAQYDIIARTRERDDIFGMLENFPGTMLSVAGQIYRFARELDTPNGEGKSVADEEKINGFKESLGFLYNDFYEPLDKAMLLRIIRMAESLPAAQRITGLDETLRQSGLNAEEWVEKAYKSSKLKRQDYAKNLIGKSSSQLEKLNDPFLKLVISLYPMSEEISAIYNEFSSNVVALRRDYSDALFQWKGTMMYPDANGTIRFTWGPVKGYKPADAVWYFPFTTLYGMREKYTGNIPFNAPERLMQMSASRNNSRWSDPDLMDIPVAFINQCDITGGNSGSPVMNAKGELIGVAFDGNYEAMISDWQYDFDIQRCIAVDIRYILFITEQFSNAGFILDEMGIKR